MNEHTKTPRTDALREEFERAVQSSWMCMRAVIKKLFDECTQLELELAAVTAERDALAKRIAELTAVECQWQIEYANEQRAHVATTSERNRLRESLRIIAGEQQCVDNTMSNVDVARAALAQEAKS